MKSFFYDKLVRRIIAFIRSTRQTEAQREKDSSIREAIETVIDGTDTRIRLVNGYQKKLKKVVGSSLQYIDALVEKIPDPIDINKKTFGSDPRVNVFFVNVKHMETSFSRSSELRDFFEDSKNRAATESITLLCMHRDEKKGFGLDLVGNILRRDVPQTTVSFSEHQVLSPAATEAEVRTGLKNCIFNGLVTNALESISRLHASKKKFESRKRTLQLQLRRLQSQHRGSVPSSLPNDDNAREIEKIEKKLAENELNFKPTRVKLVTPKNYLTLVKKTLSHPERYISLKKVSMKINRLGVKVREGSAQTGNRIDLVEIKIGDAPRRVIVLARFPRNEILPKEDFIQKANRYLTI